METLNPSSSDSHAWRTRVLEMKSKAAANASGLATKVNGQLRAKPALFAGIAAGLGFALGLTGRIARHRRRAMKHLPALVVVEGVC